MGRKLFAGNACSHRLAGAKRHHAPRQDRHLDPRLGIAADPLRLVAQHKGAEARNLHILPDRERVGHMVENRFDDRRRFIARQPDLLVDPAGDIGSRKCPCGHVDPFPLLKRKCAIGPVKAPTVTSPVTHM